MIELEVASNNSYIDFNFHYFLDNENVHSMNAEVFNTCERQLIQAIKNQRKYFDENIKIEVFAKKTGSIIDTLRVISENPLIHDIIICALTAFFTAKFVSKKDISEGTKNKIENFKSITELIEQGKLNEEGFMQLAHKDKDLLKFRSEFFKSAKKENKISKLEVESSTLIANKPVFNKITVPYQQFDSFIISDINEETPSEDEVKIYIIAPILVKGRRDNWKGYLDNMPVDFKISDKEFLEQVYNHEIKFGNGSFINCLLKTVNIIKNEVFQPSITREVIDVINYGEDNGFVNIVKRKKKHINENQTQSLFPDLK
jgi:hypothetical protein